MADSFLLRNIPDDLSDWLREAAQERRQSRNEFLNGILREARAAYGSGETPLFAAADGVRPLSADDFARSLPFKFVDLFAGIGGFRIGLERAGGTCVFSSEWDRWAQKTYRAWFGETPHGDINSIDPSSIPDCDVLAGGFPCQPFSIAGVSKKRSLGKPDGFACERQGNLFFKIADIVAVKRPPVVFLENVKNLRSHDGGRTWTVIRTTLEDLNYRVFADVIDARGWVPQHRERMYIVAFDRAVFGEEPGFEFPKAESADRQPRSLREILEEEPPQKYTLTDHLWNYLQQYAKRHAAKGNGFGFGLPELTGVSRTLSARYYKDGSEILIRQPRRNPRRLTPLECARLMGFGDREIVVSDTQAYKQFGNAVVPLVVEAIGRNINAVLGRHLTEANGGCLVKRAQLSANGRTVPAKGGYGLRTRSQGNPKDRHNGQRASQVRLTQ